MYVYVYTAKVNISTVGYFSQKNLISLKKLEDVLKIPKHRGENLKIDMCL